MTTSPVIAIIMTVLVIVAFVIILHLVHPITQAYRKHKMRKLQNLLTPNGTISEEKILKQILYLHYRKNLKWTFHYIYKYRYNSYTTTYKNINIYFYRYDAHDNKDIEYKIQLCSTEEGIYALDVIIEIPRINADKALREAVALWYQDIECKLKKDSNNVTSVKDNEQLEYYYDVLKNLF